MAVEFKTLKLQRFGRSGWFFLSSPDIPGINLFGPDEDELLGQAEIAIADLLKARGERISHVSIESIPDEDRGCEWATPSNHMVLAHAA